MSYHCCLSSLVGQYTGISNVIVQAVISNSCNTGTSALPDMYTRSPRAAG